MEKGQVGLEYLLLVGIVLGALIPIFIYSLDLSSRNIQTTRSREVVGIIAEAADNLYKMGGGKTYVEVIMPDNVENITIANNTIKMTLRIDGGYGDVFATTTPNVTGNFSTREGITKIPLSLLPNGTVYVGETA